MRKNIKTETRRAKPGEYYKYEWGHNCYCYVKILGVLRGDLVKVLVLKSYPLNDSSINKFADPYVWRTQGWRGKITKMTEEEVFLELL